MKNLTNLYVYDGNKFPSTITSDEIAELQSVENVPINVLSCGKTPVVATRLDDNIIYILSKNNLADKTLSFELGEDEFKFFIRAYEYNATDGNVVVKSFKMAGFGNEPIPFGQSFSKDSNSKIISDKMGLRLGSLYECVYRFMDLPGTIKQHVIVARRIGEYEKLSTTFYNQSSQTTGFYVPYVGDGMYVLNVKKQTSSTSDPIYEQFSTCITKNVFTEDNVSYQSSIGNFAKALIQSPYLTSAEYDKMILVVATSGDSIYCASATYIPF